jgi:hypothetical protein
MWSEEEITALIQGLVSRPQSHHTNNHREPTRLIQVRVPLSLLDPSKGVTEQVIAALRAAR